MGFLTDHPYTAITVTIDQLVTDQFEEDDVAGIFDLIETIRLSPTGPTEAARAIRKKLKYGSVHNQLRALTILDCLIENGGKRFQTQFADEPLLERMRILATDQTTDPDVKKKMSGLCVRWAAAYKDTAGMTQVAQLYKQLPQRKREPPKKQPFVDPDEDMEDDHEHDRETEVPPAKPSRPGEGSRRRTPEEIRADRVREKKVEDEQRERRRLEREREGRDSPASASGSASASRSGSLSRADQPKVKPFDLAKEKPLLLQTLAEAGTAATNLANSLKLINRERELATDNIKATENFNRCRQLRRMILRYIQSIESEDYIGALIHANDELVAGLQLYSKMSQPIENDSDSEDYDDDESESETESDSNESRRANSQNPGRRSVSVTSPRKQSTNRRRTPSVGHDASPNSVGPSAESLAHKRKPPPIPIKNPILQEFKAKMVISKPEDDEGDNPFGDANKIETPSVEKSQMTWREV
ncbi:hypothetical protein V1525DRAFT_405275 [Lipomyces kononenkoae]|uniref:Uncharacterized protein n=1 Tax=Lipomyces kononenkoae TaxID=34357 RepID=A0ACC3T1T3_LIPKO